MNNNHLNNFDLILAKESSDFIKPKELIYENELVK